MMPFKSYRCPQSADGVAQTAITLRRLRHQSALALGAVAALVLLTGLHFWPTLMPGQTPKALLLSLLAWLLVAFGVWLGLPRHLPHRRLGGANLVTLIRTGMVCLLVGMLADSKTLSPWWPLGLASLILMLVALGKAEPWVLLGGSLGYLFVGAGLIWPRLRQPLPSSLRRKAGTVVSNLSLITALVPSVPLPWSALSAAIGMTLVSLSFLVDVIWLSRH